MKVIRIFLILVCIVGYTQVYGQKSAQMESLKKKSRQELIDLAVTYINDPDFNKDHYDRTQVFVGQNKMYVVFDVAVRYIPVIVSYYVPVYVDMMAGLASVQEVSNSGFFSTDFYDSPELSSKRIKFVIDAIVKSKEASILPEGKVTDDMTMNIRETFDQYLVELFTPTTTFNCKVDKLKSSVHDVYHTDALPKKESSLSEIK